MEARARQAAPRAGRPRWLGSAAFRRTFVLQDSVIKILIIFYVSKRRGHPGVGGRHTSLVDAASTAGKRGGPAAARQTEAAPPRPRRLSGSRSVLHAASWSRRAGGMRALALLVRRLQGDIQILECA